MLNDCKCLGLLVDVIQNWQLTLDTVEKHCEIKCSHWFYFRVALMANIVNSGKFVDCWQTNSCFAKQTTMSVTSANAKRITLEKPCLVSAHNRRQREVIAVSFFAFDWLTNIFHNVEYKNIEYRPFISSLTMFTFALNTVARALL